MVPISEPESLTYSWALAAYLQHTPLVDLALCKDILGVECVPFVVHCNYILNDCMALPDRMVILMVINQCR
jgi:hypothetical protein